MKLLIDMNLTPEWVTALESKDIEAVHWSSLGDATAPDRELLEYARVNNYVLFTHDLDFGDILASSGAESPSVLQVRTLNTTPEFLLPTILKVLKKFQFHLEKGALITVDTKKSRARILPVNRG